MQFRKLIIQSIIWRGLYFFTVLLLNILIARYFKAATSGWIYYISSLYAFFLLIGSLSLEAGMGFYSSKKEVSIVKLLNFSLLWTFIVGFAVFLINNFFIIQNSGNDFIKGLLQLSSFCYVCGNLLSAFCSGIFYARNNFITPNIICIVFNLSLIALLLLTGTGWIPILNSTNYLYVYFAGFLLQGFLLAFGILFSCPERWQPILPSFKEFHKVLRYSLIAFVANLTFFLVYRADYWFIKNYCSAEDLGNYIQVSKLGQSILILPSIMASAVFPLVAGGHKEEVNKGLKLLSRITLLVIGALCGFLALTGKWLFPFVFSQSFSRMYEPFLLLIPGILSISTLYPLTAYYSGKDMIMVNIKGTLIALVFIIGADFIFIPHYGLYAAAIVSSLGYMLYHGYVLVIFGREYQTAVTGFFAIKKSDFLWMKDFLFTNLLKKYGKQ